MTTANLCSRFAVEPPPGLHEIGPTQGASVLAGRTVAGCIIADASASWGLGYEAASLTLGRISGTSLDSTQIDVLAHELEESAFLAQEQLARENEEADALFAATALLARERTISCVWAGDILAAVCDPTQVMWINYPSNQVTNPAPVATRLPAGATRYPGLLGCTRAQAGGSALLERARDFDLRNDQVVLLLSRSVWSHLDDATILAESRRVASELNRGDCSLHETLLRTAKARGATGYRAAAVLWFGQGVEKPNSRRLGYRAVAVDTGSEQSYAIEELESRREVIRVTALAERADALSVDYTITSRDLNRATARCLIYELLLEVFLADRYRGRVSKVAYHDVAAGAQHVFAYGWPLSPR